MKKNKKIQKIAATMMLLFMMASPLCSLPIANNDVIEREETSISLEDIEDYACVLNNDNLIVKAPYIEKEEEVETNLLEDLESTITKEEPPIQEVVVEGSLKPSKYNEEVLNEGILSFSPSDERLLLRIASCEAGDQGVEGMAYVIRVVLNRVESNQFPNTIYDVIYEPKQFSATKSHWWYEEYIADGAKEALEMVCNGWDSAEGALYFCMPQSNSYHRAKLEYIKTYRDHEFYK